MVYGYARVSTMGQARDGNSLEAQMSALRQAGAERIYRDVYSGKPERRPQLDRLMKVIENGDRLIITRLDRIARSLIQGVQLLETLSERGVIVEVLNIGIIDDTPTGKLIRNIMLSFSEFEHDMIVQRTQEGKAIARQNADFRDGRPKKFTRISYAARPRAGTVRDTLVQTGRETDRHQHNDDIQSKAGESKT